MAKDRVTDDRTSGWTFVFHPVGRPAWAAAFGIFVVVTATRLIGIGTPPSIYFDEVAFARTAAQYAGGAEPTEWTHPPLSKQLMGLSIRAFSGFGVRGSAPAPSGLGRGIAAASGDRIAWADGRTLRTGTLGPSCRVRADPLTRDLDVEGEVVAAGDGAIAVAGTGPDGPVLTLHGGGRELWRTPLEAAAVRLAVLGRGVWAVLEDGRLVRADEVGVAEVAHGAGDLEAVPEGGRVWATFPADRTVAAWSADGEPDRSFDLVSEPRGLGVGTVHPSLSRPPDVSIIASTPSGLETVLVQPEPHLATVDGVRADVLASDPRHRLVWGADGRVVRAIEPVGPTVLAEVRLDEEPRALLGHPGGGVVAVGPSRLTCLDGDPVTAWRFPSALAGGALAALALLLAVRVLGGLTAGMIAAALVALDGTAFALSRIGTTEALLAASILGAWFCAASALHRCGAGGSPSRAASHGWLAGAALVGGAALATKWVGAWTMAGLVAVVVWHTRRSAGQPLRRRTALAILVLLPVAVYLTAYLSNGDSLADLPALHSRMLRYHTSGAEAHWFESGWYEWAVGIRPIRMWAEGAGSRAAELWSVANPVVYLGGFAAMVALAVAARRRRSATLAFLPFVMLVQWVPFGMVTRSTFLYHYLPVVPLLSVALGRWAARGKVRAVLVVAAAASAFGLLLPLLDGWHVGEAYLDAVKRAGSWMFPAS